MSATIGSGSRGGAGTFAVAAFTVVSWASIFPITRLCLEWFTPFQLVTLRILISAVALLAVLLTSGRRRWPTPRQFAALAVCSFFGVALYNLLLSVGLVTLSAGAASFLTNTIPIFTVLLSFLVNGEKPAPLALLGMVVAFAGIAILASGQPGGFSFGSGTSLVLAATLCSALYIVLQRRLVHALAPMEAAGWLMVLSALFLLPFTPDAIGAAMTAPLWPVLLIVFVAIIPGALGQVAWLNVLKKVPAGRAAAMLFLIPPLATLIGVVMLDEIITPELLIGGASAVAGVAIVHGSRRKQHI